MRIMIKGGVWKNTEDEILKAAVMKYGKNQWARISSLLVRKSAKQCKARWYEWLDPSIKKTEWTREEDEKLLHLAKLMPTQWRTIAPIVGRTPSQCLERYEKLLDAACAKDENYEPSDDPRKLRPGEIDPNPESKPARPDPVDMDEDEKEMLSEARARLANTRGKKAKRKAREKQLEEARRLASLQKRRELKAAGIDTRHRRRKRKGIDYNAEIPFEKRPPPGFFDVSGEEKAVEQPKFPTTIEELEGKRRVDIEAQLRKQDIAKNKIAQRQDAPSAILQANKLNDPEAVRKRSKLMLPAPQISDQELEEIAKMGYASDLISGADELAEGSGATRALLANYSQTPRQGMTPMRTPQRTPAGKADAIMMEAENLARLRESQTPLLGGENPELHPSDFSGVTPRKREVQTPNPMATPLMSPGPTALTPRIGMTPSRDGYSYGATPRATPFRDELHINEDIEMLEQHRQAELRRNLRSGLTSLPQPKNEYQIVIQPIPEENEEVEDKIEEDMSDRIAREKALEQARQEALLKKRSKVLQRELPRPPSASLDLIRNLLMRKDEDKSSFVPPTLFEQADQMINKELLALLEHDNAKYPLEEKAEKEKKKGVKPTANGKSSMPVPEIEDFEEDELKEADYFITEEVQFLRVAMGHENESFDDFVKARDACQEDLMYFPGRNTFGLASVAGNSEKLASLQNDFEIMKKRMDDEAKKATKLENKIKLLTHGHQTRAGKLWSQIEATFKQMDTAATELECFQALQKQEIQAASYRVSSLVEEVNKQKGLERNLQQRYGDLIAEHDRVQRLLEEHRERLRLEEEIAAKQRALEEEITAKQRALEEEIAEKQQAHEEEISAKSQSVEEDAVAKNHTVDEEMMDVCQQQDVLEAVDACRLNSGLNQADFSISDPTPRLNVESSNVEFTAAQGQATHSRDMVPEGLDHSKESTAIDTNATLAEDVAGIGADGQMTFNSDGHQVEDVQPQASAGGFNTDAACNAGVLDEMMIVDSIQTASELGASVVGNASNEMSRPDSGLNQAEFSISDPAPRLNVGSLNVECTAAQGQATHSGDMAPEGLDHLKETTAINTNATLAEDVAGIGADGQMTVNSDGHQVEEVQPQASAGGFNTDAACNAGVLDEMMAVDSIQTASELGASVVGNASNGLVGDPAAAAATDSSNSDSVLTEGIIGDSSDQLAVASLAVSGENVISDSSDHLLDGSVNCMVTVEEHIAVNLTVNSELPDESNVLAPATGEMESS